MGVLEHTQTKGMCGENQSLCPHTISISFALWAARLRKLDACLGSVGAAVAGDSDTAASDADPSSHLPDSGAANHAAVFAAWKLGRANRLAGVIRFI